MADNTVVKLGRLALRAEGEWWVAYYAMPDTMDGAIALGRMHVRFARNADRKHSFMALMREAVGDIIEEKIGTRPEWPDGPVRAPEHERSGRA